MSEHHIDYPRMVREALRHVVHQVLSDAAEAGVPEPHHFYLTFRTHHPGVELADFLREQYPEEMTVVLQHQFRELAVDEEGFAVTLSFGGRAERIRVPYAALVTFVDPSAEFGLRFEPAASPEASEETPEAQRSDEPAEETAGEDKGPADVVSIDKFRKP